MTTEEQAKAIVEKYRCILPFKLAPNYAIKCATQCAIKEVEACIDALDEIGYAGQDYMDILSHLKQM